MKRLAFLVLLAGSFTNSKPNQAGPHHSIDGNHDKKAMAVTLFKPPSMASGIKAKLRCRYYAFFIFVKSILSIALLLLTFNSLLWLPSRELALAATSSYGHHQQKTQEAGFLPFKRESPDGNIHLLGKKNEYNSVSLGTRKFQTWVDDKNETNLPMTTASTTNAQSHDNSVNHNSDTKPVNRTLVVLIGDLRCGEKAWQSLYTNVLDTNSADLALLGTNDINNRYPYASLLNRAKYIWETPEYDEWADALDIINGTDWRTTVLPQISNYSLSKGLLGGIFGTPSSGAIQGMMKYWLSQRLQSDPTVFDNYDTFVVTRTDQYYVSPLDLKTTMQECLNGDVYIPFFENYSGICDRFMAVCGKDKLLKALDVLPPFLNDYDPVVYGKLHNPEGLLLASLRRKQLDIQRFYRSMFTCASIDGNDPTRWRKSTMSTSPTQMAMARQRYGVDFKYKNEFEQASGIFQARKEEQKKKATKKMDRVLRSDREWANLDA